MTSVSATSPSEVYRKKLGAKDRRRRKRSAIRRHGEFCFFCQIPLTWKETTLDHLVPIGLGGTHKVENLVPACYDCNQRKGCSDHASL